MQIREGVGFGTSGVRAQATKLTDRVCYVYTCAFLRYVTLLPGCGKRQLAIAGDRRASTPRLVQAVVKACYDEGWQPVMCGQIPTPALCLFAFSRHIPSIMVTGSHIAPDRNGLKFNLPDGEVLKVHEQAILSQYVSYPTSLFTKTGSFRAKPPAPPHTLTQATKEYQNRYLTLFPPSLLRGLTIGVWGHSSVSRTILCRVLALLGAQVIKLGFCTQFTAVDTESVSTEILIRLKKWQTKHILDCLVSTDGDGDRPLLTDEQGTLIRPDLLAILTAKFLGSQAVAAPQTVSTALESSHYFQTTIRTKIGSPYVIAATDKLLTTKHLPVAGFEANGGFFVSSPHLVGKKTLSPLPTRDALIVLLAVLALKQRTKHALSRLVSTLPHRYTASVSLPWPDALVDLVPLEKVMHKTFGKVKHLSRLDGIRMHFVTNITIHLRLSHNSPELRLYVEAGTQNEAEEAQTKASQAIATVLTPSKE